MLANEGTAMGQKEENHHYVSAKEASRQATEEPPTSHERQHRIYVERGEKVKRKFESLQLSRKDQVSISNLRSGHYPEMKYCPTRLAERSILFAGSAVLWRRQLHTQLVNVLESTTLQPSYSSPA